MRIAGLRVVIDLLRLLKTGLRVAIDLLRLLKAGLRVAIDLLWLLKAVFINRSSAYRAEASAP